MRILSAAFVLVSACTLSGCYVVSVSGLADAGSAVFDEGLTLTRTLIIKGGYCDDGMSDREYGLTATLFHDTPDGSSVQSGCCTLDASR